MIDSSFLRIIITICTALALLSLLIRNYLKLYWRDFKNTKKMQLLIMEVEAKINALHNKSPNQTFEEDMIPDEEDSLIEKNENYLWEWVKTCFTYEFMFEVIILVVHPIPNVDYEYEFLIINMLSNKNELVPVHYMLGDFLFAFMFFRCYFLLRTIMNFSVYSNLNSKKICNKHNFECDTSFTFKALVQK